jgi:glycosyltransferase involved in cell wall biosynthesis
MADAIVTLLADGHARAAMGAAGAARVRARFSAERMVQETLALYRRVAMHSHAET